MRIVEHINKVWEARDNHLHQVYLLWTLGDGSKSNQGRVSFLPVSVLDVLGDEGDDWLNDIIANDLGNFNEAATRREVHTKLVIFLVLIFDVESLDALEEKNDKLSTALGNIAFNVLSLLLSRMFLLSDGSPHFNSLSSHLLIRTSGSLSCNGTYLGIEVFELVVLLPGNFDENLHCSCSNVLILILEGLE